MSWRCSATTAAPATTSFSSRLPSEPCSTFAGWLRRPPSRPRGGGGLRRRRAAEAEEGPDALDALAVPFELVTRDGFTANEFRTFERHGVHVTPVHFYGPIPDTAQLSDEVWTASELVGIDMNDDEQLRLLRDVFPQFRGEYEALPTGSHRRSHGFPLWEWPLRGNGCPRSLLHASTSPASPRDRSRLRLLDPIGRAGGARERLDRTRLHRAVIPTRCSGKVMRASHL